MEINLTETINMKSLSAPFVQWLQPNSKGFLLWRNNFKLFHLDYSWSQWENCLQRDRFLTIERASSEQRELVVLAQTSQGKVIMLALYNLSKSHSGIASISVSTVWALHQLVVALNKSAKCLTYECNCMTVYICSWNYLTQRQKQPCWLYSIFSSIRYWLLPEQQYLSITGDTKPHQ